MPKATTPEEIAAKNRLNAIWKDKAKKLGLTQKKMAERWGCSQGNITHYMTGRNVLTYQAVLWFAKSLEVNPADIYPELFKDFGLVSDSGFLELYEACSPEYQKVLKELIRAHLGIK